MPGPRLADEFLAVAESFAPDPGLEAALAEYVTVARRRWPQLEVDEVELVRHLAARAREGQLQPLEHAGDLLLSYACGCSVHGAVEVFEREYGLVIDRVLMHRRASADLAADAKQMVRERLLVGDASNGSRPRIMDYRGSGPLRGWVASTAATTLAMLRRAAGRRREQPQAESEGEGPSLEARIDPEIEHLKVHYKAHVEAAIIEALGQLGAREAALLRLSVGERMSIDALGSMYSVNRATAARWLAAARASLLDKTKQILRQRLSLTERECDSLVGLVRSSLDVSIVRRLSENAG